MRPPVGAQGLNRKAAAAIAAMMAAIARIVPVRLERPFMSRFGDKIGEAPVRAPPRKGRCLS